MEYEYKEINIKGSKKFIEQTIAALDLIKKSKKDYFKINKYLNSIRSNKISGINLRTGVFHVGEPTAFHSLEWYAGAIVHDTHHFYLHNIKKFSWIPINYKKHEELSTKEQIRFLKVIKAPKELIKHCKEMLKTDYWLKEKRTW